MQVIRFLKFHRDQKNHTDLSSQIGNFDCGYFTIIGGHGFLDGVGVHTPGVGQKICRPPLVAKIFSRRPFHQGVILLNRNEKKCSPQGSICPIFFSPWGYQGGGVYLFHLGCQPQKVFYPGVHPPTPPPRAHLWLACVKPRYKGFNINRCWPTCQSAWCIDCCPLQLKKRWNFEIQTVLYSSSSINWLLRGQKLVSLLVEILTDAYDAWAENALEEFSLTLLPFFRNAKS